MTTVKELRDWLARFGDEEMVGIDEGGLTLEIVGRAAYFELGGLTEISIDPDEEG